MKKQITSVSMLQSAKVMAALYFVLSLPFLVIMGLGTMFSASPGLGIAMMLIFPILYAVFGFLFTLLGAWIYNMVASKMGGFEFTTTEVN
ncbi:MAG: hypothetical protein V4631_04180 [Pseudomonadota bacterium]